MVYNNAMRGNKIVFRIVICLVILLILGFGAAVYLNNVYLPQAAKSLIIASIEENTGYKAQLGGIKLNIFKGLVLENLTVSEKTGEAFLSARQVSFGWLILPLLKKKEFIIPFVRVYSPGINLKRNKDGTLNLPLLKSQAKTLPVFIYKLAIDDAEINLEDDAVSPGFKQRVVLDGKFSLSPPESVRYEISGTLSGGGVSSGIQLKGEIGLSGKTINCIFDLTGINLTDYSAYYQGAPFTLREALLKRVSGKAAFRAEKIEADIVLESGGIDVEIQGTRLAGKASLAVKVDFNANLLRADIKVKAAIPDLAVTREKLGLSGKSVLDGKLSYNLTSRKIDYSGKLALDQAAISGLGYINKIEALSGEFYFSPQGVKAVNLKAKALDADWDIDANFAGSPRPEINAKISSESADLAIIGALLKETQFKNIPFSAAGAAKIALEINLPLSALEKTEIKGKLNLKNNRLRLEDLKREITDMEGEIIFDTDNLEWRKLSGVFNEKRYSSSGKIAGFARPLIDFSLNGDVFKIEGRLAPKGDLIGIQQLKGVYLNSRLAITGSASSENPFSGLDISGDLSLNLADLKPAASDFMPQSLPLLEKINPQGVCEIKLSASGALSDWRRMSIAGGLAAETVSLYGLKLVNPRLSLTLKDTLIPQLDFSSDAYAGKIKIGGSVDLSSDAPKFNLILAISGVDLAKLKADTPLKDKTLSGALAADLALSGEGINTDGLIGKGLIQISGGDLWEFAPLEKLAEFLFIPSFESIRFNEASADLIIREGNIYSDEISLKSEEVALYGYGKMDFKGNLDYTVKSEFSAEITRDSSDLTRILSSVLDSVNQFATVKITGTIANPKTALVPTFLENLKQIKQIFR